MDCSGISHGLWPRRFGFRRMVAAAILCGAGAAQAQTPATAGTRAGRVAAEQQEKAKDLKPYAPNKAEVLLAKVEEQFITGALHWHPFFQSAYAGGGFTLGAGYLTHVGSYNTLDVRGSYTLTGYKPDRDRVPRARVSSTAAARSRSSAAGARPRRSASTGLGTGNTSSDDRANYGFRQPYASAHARRAADAAGCCSWPAASSTRSGTSVPGEGSRAVGRGGLHARDAARPGREDHLPAHAGHRGLRLAHLRRLLAARRLLRRHATTTSRTATTPTASARWTTRRSSTSRSSATPGCSRCTGGSRRPTRTTTRDPVLHAAGARRRLEPARLLELALPRSPQPARCRPSGGCW